MNYNLIVTISQYERLASTALESILRKVYQVSLGCQKRFFEVTADPRLKNENELGEKQRARELRRKRDLLLQDKVEEYGAHACNPSALGVRQEDDTFETKLGLGESCFKIKSKASLGCGFDAKKIQKKILMIRGRLLELEFSENCVTVEGFLVFVS